MYESALKNLKTWQGILIWFLAVLIIYGVLYDLENIVDFKHYKFMFQWLPETRILLRYYFSLGFRVLTFLAAAGLFIFSNLSRKIMIGIFFFNIITIYFKHPYQSVLNSNIYFNFAQNLHTRPAPWDPNLTYHPEVFDIMISLHISDILFAAFGLFVLSRSTVKRLF